MKDLSEYQKNVWDWCKLTFNGITAWDTIKERNYRFIEEAIELVQATGLEKNDVLDVVDYVFDRPTGEVSQEIGGVMITLLALAAKAGESVNNSLADEYSRIMQPEVINKIRKKQLDKNQRFL